MRGCPNCNEKNFAVTWMYCEIFNTFYEEDGTIYLSDDDQCNFEPSKKVIECRSCGWQAPTSNEDEFVLWLAGKEFTDPIDHMSYLGGLFK
jgi:hypothetical protein